MGPDIDDPIGWLNNLNFQTDESKLIVYLLSAVMPIIAVVMAMLIKERKHEDTWYRGRALAESCKILTWRFIMHSEYFEGYLSAHEVESRFINRIREISNEFADLNSKLNASRLNSPIITNKMRNVRALNLADRKKYYLEQRIRNQIEWYSSKGDSNKTKYENWFLAVIACQVLALLSIGSFVKFPLCNPNLVVFFYNFCWRIHFAAGQRISRKQRGIHYCNTGAKPY